MEDNVHVTKEEIETMSYSEAVGLVEKQIAMGKSAGDSKSARLTRALEIILEAAKNQFMKSVTGIPFNKIIYLTNERGKPLVTIKFDNDCIVDDGSIILDKVNGDVIDGVFYETYRITVPVEYGVLENISNEHLLDEIKERMVE